MFALGEIVPLTVQIRDANGALANATAVTLTITLPDRMLLLPPVANPSPGVYQHDHLTTQSGRHLVRWVATGVNATALPPWAFVVSAVPATSAWPPLLRDVKSDLGIAADDTRDDDSLAADLAAAVAHVEVQRGGDFNFAADPLSSLPAPGDDLLLGTVRLALRLHTRRRSPDGLVDLGELGTSRVSFSDPDIERLLGIGRFRAPMVGG